MQKTIESFKCDRCSEVNHVYTCPICFKPWIKLDGNNYHRPKDCEMHAKMYEMSEKMYDMHATIYEMSEKINYTKIRIESLENKMNTLIQKMEISHPDPENYYNRIFK